MIRQWVALVVCHLNMTFRDRILNAIFAVAICMLVLVPSFSNFSMRQVQELAITISLSAISLTLLVLTLLLGSSSIWRDIERRFISSVLTLPVSRAQYVLAKFTSISLTLSACGSILGMASIVVIKIAVASYPSDQPVVWAAIFWAIIADVFKYILLSSFAILLSTVSTSFFLPFFSTLAIFLAGSASQEVYEYVSGQFGQRMSPLTVWITKTVYYLLPNFAAFNFKVQAVYSLKLTAMAVIYPLLYTMSFCSVILGIAIWAFNRRELA